MADVNVNAPAEQAPAMAPPTHTFDQILPRIRCFHYFLNNSINLYSAVWETVRYDNKTGSYSCQLDEQWFDLTKDTLRDALQITPVDTNNAFSSPPTPDALIKFVNDLGEQYYNAYLEKVAKHQRYLAGEEVSDPDSPTPKPAKATKPKATKQPKPLAPKATTKKPKPAPAKPQEKKQNSLQLVDEFIDEGVPMNEPRIGDEEADIQKAMEEKVKGKGKEKVSDEQVSLDLLTLQTPKKKSPTEQYIFQRRTPTPTEPSGHTESPSLYAKLGLTDSDTESDEEVPPVVKSGAQDEGQAGPNPGVQDEGQAGSNPGNAADSQPQPSHVVHAGSNLKHMDLEATENLKLPTEDQVRIEEPTSSTGTLSSLQNLDKELSLTSQLYTDKSQEDETKKTNAKAEVQSMIMVPIHQDTSSVPLMTTPVIDLTVSQPVPTVAQTPLPTLTTTVIVTTITTTTLPLPPQPQQGSSDSMLIQCIVDEIITDAVDWAIQAFLRDRFRDLPEANMKEILYHRMWESNSYQAHEDHKQLYEALKKSMARDHTDQLLTDLAEVYSSGDEDIGHDHIPTVILRQSWWKPLTKDRPATPKPAWSIPSSDLPVPMNNWASALASTYAPPPENSLLIQTSDMAIFMDYKLLPLGGPPGQVTIQSDFFFNKDLEYLRYGRKGGRPALLISKIKAAYYLDVGFEQMVPDQMWIEKECKYDIAAMYGISHWWFQRQ
ncbi:hypothetical protein Tco_0976685 [Tanacetum coccineum]|uniref:Uncharacterized protein n=1 Tax=Tanacetum coccineum TaxID=301880 RepID=A0ABQ5EI99_9ASTR